MLKKRIIATLLWGETGLVKPRAFGEHRKRGSMMDAVRVMNARNIDELIILDITATPNKRGPRFEELKEFTGQCFCPVTVGGGVASVEDAVALLNAGADKVSVCTAMIDNPELLTELAYKIGSQSVVASMDVLPRVSHEDVGFLAACYEGLGAGEILVTEVTRDGTLEGYDLDLIREVASWVHIPVIANGGCSGPEDMLRAFEAGADAVAAGALWQYTEHTPKSCARYLADKNIPVRT